MVTKSLKFLQLKICCQLSPMLEGSKITVKTVLCCLPYFLTLSQVVPLPDFLVQGSQALSLIMSMVML